MAEFLSSPLSTPIHLLMEFSRRGDLDGLRDVLNECPDLVNEISPSGQNALHAASLGGHVDCVEALLKAKADINAQSNRGDSALHLATSRNNISIILYLIQEGIDTDIVNSDGVTAEALAHKDETRTALRGVDPNAAPAQIVFANDDDDSEDEE